MTRDGIDRHSRTRLILDGFDRAVRQKSDRAFSAWLKLALRWGYLPEARELTGGRR